MRNMSTKSGVEAKMEVKAGASEWKKVCRPAGWEEEVDGVKQTCWCGEEWCDNHEDGNHSDVSVEEARSVLGKRKAEAEEAEEEGESESEESEEELPEGWQKGWYGPVPCEE